MNGFPALVMLLSFLLLTSIIVVYSESNTKKDYELLDFLSSAEKASFERKIAEENIHYLIEKTLLEEAEKKSIGPLMAKKAVISKLNAYFDKLSLTKKPSLSEMDSSIKVLITVMKRVVLSQFFNSGKDLESSFQVGDFNQSVLIPKNYSVQVVSFA